MFFSRPTKLQNKIGLLTLAVSILFLILTTIILYISIRSSILSELDADLQHRIDDVIVAIEQGRLQPETFLQLNSVYRAEWLDIIVGDSAVDRLPKDTVFTVVMPAGVSRNETTTHRRMIRKAWHNGTTYAIVITESMVQWDNITAKIFQIVASSVVLLVLALYLTNTLALGAIFSPLKRTIHTLTGLRSLDILAEKFPASTTEEINELHISLNMMFQRLTDHLQEQQEFLQTASHELLTPPAIIRQKIETLLLQEHIPPLVVQRLAEIDQTLARLSRLNRSIVLLAKINSSGFATDEHVQLSSVVENVFAELRDAAELKEISFTIELPVQLVVVRGNADLLHIMCYNVVQNAVKFTPPHHAVTVILSNSKLLIMNTGTTIPESEQEKIFRPFAKANTTGKSSTPGLGLSIVKRIAQLHKYQVHVQTSHPDTVLFTIELENTNEI